jgi:hypothetical protein
MSWIVFFAGFAVLLVAVNLGIVWWVRIVERERRMAAQRPPRVFETWQEPPPDEQDATDGNQTS